MRGDTPQRRETSSQLASRNPILSEGEIAYETDRDRFAFGDGKTRWSKLKKFSSGGDTSPSSGGGEVLPGSAMVAPQFEGDRSGGFVIDLPGGSINNVDPSNAAVWDSENERLISSDFSNPYGAEFFWAVNPGPLNPDKLYTLEISWTRLAPLEEGVILNVYSMNAQHDYDAFTASLLGDATVRMGTEANLSTLLLVGPGINSWAAIESEPHFLIEGFQVSVNSIRVFEGDRRVVAKFGNSSIKVEGNTLVLDGGDGLRIGNAPVRAFDENPDTFIRNGPSPTNVMGGGLILLSTLDPQMPPTLPSWLSNDADGCYITETGFYSVSIAVTFAEGSALQDRVILVKKTTHQDQFVLLPFYQGAFRGATSLELINSDYSQTPVWLYLEWASIAAAETTSVGDPSSVEVRIVQNSRLPKN